MIRGAFILAVGFSLGYGKAMRDSDEVSQLLRELIEELRHFPTGTTPEDPVPEEEIIEVEPDEDDDTEPDDEQQGENP